MRGAGRGAVMQMTSALFLLILAYQARAEVALSCVFLIEMNAFTAQGLSARFETVLASAFSTNGVTLQSIQSTSLSGAEVRQLYFPKRTDISLFSVVHLTRVVASILADAGAAKSVLQLLPSLCADLAPMAIEHVGPPSQSGFDAFIQMFPPSLGFVMVILWVVTAASCGVCWICWLCQCCSGRKPEKTTVSNKDLKPLPEDQDTHRESNTEDPVPSAPPPPSLLSSTPRRRFVEPPTTTLTPFLMRLPLGLQCADRADPCATPLSYGGPAAVRLGW
jgi:hypothetical protein